MEGFLRTCLNALHAEDTLRPTFSLVGIIRNIDIHWADTSASTAGNTFFGVVFHPHKGEITGRL